MDRAEICPMYGDHPGYQTTYRDVFQPFEPSRLPPIRGRFHQTPCLSVKDKNRLQPRQFPLEPTGPQRIIEIERAPGLGLGTNTIQTEKLLDVSESISRSIPPHRVESTIDLTEKAEGMKPRPPSRRSKGRRVTNDVVDALVNALEHTSTTTIASEEACLPVIETEPANTTLEENADMVKYRPQKYEREAETWQTVGWQWDRVQPRHRTSNCYVIDISKPKLLRKRQAEEKLMPISDKLKQLVESKQVKGTYVRPTPGYAGFKPRAPVDGPIEKNEDPRRCSVMKASYRPLPADIPKELHHRGPFSKTVTLTYPYNPFNKVEEVSL
ncbi:unnamed protein product [Owenia fusiformis]|uniref:Uncharacterized protein n=1 Tax=Owenia fusiformis TaxID=6347 RepID=A0A8J1UT19_OWEFU|nr:unnamed protein product [Owenia fusiformis]